MSFSRIATLLVFVSAACASKPPPPPPPPPERAVAVGEAEGPVPPPGESDWQIIGDQTVPIGTGLTPSNVSFSPKGDRMVLSSWVRQAKREKRDAQLLFVSLASPNEIEKVTVPGVTENGEVRVSWSHDGKTVAYSGGSDVRLYDVGTSKTRTLAEWKGSQARSVRSLTFSPDDKRIATLVTKPTGVRYAVVVVRVADGDTQEYVVADQTVELAGWSAGESIALVEWDRKPLSSAKKRIGALDLETGHREKWALPRGLDAAYASPTAGVLAIDPDGVVWELEEGKWTRRFGVQHKLQPAATEARRDTLHYDGVGLAPGGKVAVICEVEADGSGGSGLVRVLRLDKGK